MRIGVGGLSVEACTFSPLRSGREDFRLVRGQALLDQYDFLSEHEDVEYVPLVWARAMPGGPIRRELYEEIEAELVRRLEEAGPLDGLFLHMHGASHAEGLEDLEARLVGAMRRVVGEGCLISASYDLHGNPSAALVERLDLLTAYRTAPHVDEEATHARALDLLVRCLRQGWSPHLAWRRVPLLLPGELTSTLQEPGASLYASLPAVIREEGLLDASILAGYAWADEPRAGASVVAMALDAEAAQRGADRLAEALWAARSDFDFGVPALPVDEAIQAALSAEGLPVVLSDSGDNPTAGGVGDVPFVLERLLALGVPDAVYASLVDSEAVATCALAGVGAEVSVGLGGKLDPAHGPPLEVRGVVEVLVDDQAVLRVEGVRVVLTSRRAVFHHLAQFERLGLSPRAHALIVVKIGYLVPELAALAGTALLALSPGAVPQDLSSLSYCHLDRPVFPLDGDAP